MARGMILVNHDHNFVKPVEPESAEIIETSSDSPAAMELLRGWKEESLFVRCECRLVFHTVDRDGCFFLRRNPKQSIACQLACGIGQNLDELKQLTPFDGPLPRPDAPLGLILRTHEVSDSVDSGDIKKKKASETERQKPDRAKRFRSMFWTLSSVLEDLGLDGWNPADPPWDWNTFWDAFYESLKKIRLHRDSQLTAADISWCPTPKVKGLEKALAIRISENWDLKGIRPEAWMFFITERIDEDGFFEGHRQSPKTREKKARSKEPNLTPVSFTVKRHQMALVGRTGPYLGFAVGTIGKIGKFGEIGPDAIAVKRLALQAIAAPNWPLPVESGPERDTAFTLWRLGVPFRKPLFGDVNLRPDFLLPRERIILEVQGMNTQEYRLRKADIHRKLLLLPEYQGWKLLTFDVNEGETVEDLKDNLEILKW